MFCVVFLLKSIIIGLMEILGKILGSPARVKIMRSFLLNPKITFDGKILAKKCRINTGVARKELRLLASAGFCRKNTKGYIFNPLFQYSEEMEELLVNSDTIDRETLIRTFKKTGRMKLLVVSGIFIKNKDTRLDLLVVGDKMKKNRVEEEVKKLEAEIGTELSYAVFETKEFLYRVSMFDKLVRDILDFPHEVLFGTKELSTQASKKA